MSRDPRRREKKRIKRLRKRKEQRRRDGVSPYIKIGQHGRQEECLINKGWQTDGMAAIYVLRGMPGGAHAMASFLVDNWCIGLKDAWGRINILRDEYREMMDRLCERMEMVPIELEEARKIVASGIRFSNQNGFRLPDRHERWVSMIGGVGDWRTADLTGFGKDGKLMYVGRLEDLEKRLIGCTVEEFLNREDVESIMGMPGFDESDDEFEDDFEDFDEEEEGPDDEDGEEDEEDAQAGFDNLISDIRQKMLNAARQWCFANGEAPHPRLAEAVDLTLESMLQIPAGADLGGEPGQDDEATDSAAKVAEENIDRFISVEDPRNARELKDAMAQCARFASSFPTPGDFAREMGFGDDAEDRKD